MTAPVKLQIILGENNSEKLTPPSGIPESVDDLEQTAAEGHGYLFQAHLPSFLPIHISKHDKNYKEGEL